MANKPPATGNLKHNKPRLGRGLSSLIASSTDAPADAGRYRDVTPQKPIQPAPTRGQPAQIPIDSIAPNPYQPRREFKPEELAELADSIAQQGILQPLIVIQADPGAEKPYVLVAGGRRLRAAKQAGLKTVPCVIRKAGPQQMLEWALVENIQRADLNPLERAQAYQDYMNRFSLTQAQAAQRLSQPRATVANYLRILDLPDLIQRMLIDGPLSFGHAKVLASLAGQQQRQIALAKKVAAKSLSVRQLEELATAAAVPSSAHTAGKSPNSRPAYIVDIEHQLATALATRVTIKPGRAKNTGKIIIDYHGIDDFDRVTDALGVKLQG